MGRHKLPDEEKLSQQVIVRHTLEQAIFLDALAYLHITDEDPTKPRAIRFLIDAAMNDPSINTPELQAIMQARRAAIADSMPGPQVQ